VQIPVTFLEHLSSYHLFKNDSAAWSSNLSVLCMVWFKSTWSFCLDLFGVWAGQWM